MERKAEKRSLYVDGRDNDDKGEDSMDNWDEAKLKEVVEKKHGESKTPTTTIVRHFFNSFEGFSSFFIFGNDVSCQLTKDRFLFKRKIVLSLEEGEVFIALFSGNKVLKKMTNLRHFIANKTGNLTRPSRIRQRNPPKVACFHP